MAFKSILLLCILFMFIEIKLIHHHSCVICAMKAMSIYNDFWDMTLDKLSKVLIKTSNTMEDIE